MKIEGLPEGVDCVRIGKAAPGEFELVGRRIVRGDQRNDSTAMVIVRPETGYDFILDVVDLTYRVAKTFDPPLEVVISLKYRLTNAYHQQRLDELTAQLKALPGYVDEPPIQS